MTTCRCCGQPVNVQAATSVDPVRPAERGGPAQPRGFAGRAGPAHASGAADAVWVDDALMACCNAAYEAAAARGAGQVEIAHFLFAAARMDAARGWFASAGLSPERVAGALVGEMRRRQEGGAASRGGRIETSSQLQALLYRAREDGLRRRLSSISIADVLNVLAAQADGLGMREKLSAWFAASGLARGRDAGAERMSRPAAELARGAAHVRAADRDITAERPVRERSSDCADRGRADRVAEDVARDVAGGGFARVQGRGVSCAVAPVQRGDDRLLMRLEARLAEQDRALRAMSEQLAHVEAMSRLAGGLSGSGRISRTQRGYRASSSRWRQRRSGGVGSNEGGDTGSRRGRSAGAGRSGGSCDGTGERPRRGGGGGSNGGRGHRAGDGAGLGSGSGSGRGNSRSNAAAGGGAGSGSGGGTGSGTGSGFGSGNPSPRNGATGTASARVSGASASARAGRANSSGAGGRKSSGQKKSGHGPRDRYSRMRLLRQRLSSRRNSRSSRVHDHERDARLPRERDPREPLAERAPREPRQERGTSRASGGTSWARAPWPERGSSRQDPQEPRPARDDAIDEDDGETREKRFYLALDDDVVAAPSIGPRTAGRLIPNGIVTVRDLLSCDADELAAQVTARHITADRIRAWQAQARLVCTIPWLRGTHAQLLVGAGYTSAEDIAADAPDAVCAAILAFAGTREGQSVLRSGEPPQMERLLKWVDHASLAEPERAELAA